MPVLTPVQIAQAAKAGGFPDSAIPMAVAVALAESSGNSNSHNTNTLTGDNSYGLWQINMLNEMGPERRKKYGLSSNDELFNPVTNARVANAMSGGGKNWGPWSTYPAKSALYIPKGRAAAKSISGSTPAQQAKWFEDWNDPFDLWPDDAGPAPKSPWESLTGENFGETLNDAGDSGIWSIGTLLTGFSNAITNPDNWRNWAYVGIGGALVIAGLVIVTKPYAQQAANVLPAGRLMNVAKKATGKG